MYVGICCSEAVCTADTNTPVQTYRCFSKSVTSTWTTLLDTVCAGYLAQLSMRRLVCTCRLRGCASPWHQHSMQPLMSPHAPFHATAVCSISAKSWSPTMLWRFSYSATIINWRNCSSRRCVSLHSCSRSTHVTQGSILPMFLQRQQQPATWSCTVCQPCLTHRWLLCVQLVFVARRLPALLSNTCSRAALSALPLPVLLELLGHEELLVDSVGHTPCTCIWSNALG